MSLILDGTAGVTFNNSTVQASAGVVLQVVNATYSTSTSNSTSTLADTGLTASITPKFATSKILVLINQAGLEKTAADTQNSIELWLYKSTTALAKFAGYANYTNSALRLITASASCCYLDSPATTSATAYKTQFCNIGNNTAAVLVQSQTAVSTITLMEIAA